MKRKIFALFLIVFSAMSFNLFSKDTASIPEKHIRIHYKRSDSNYKNMVMWAWNDVEWVLTEWPKGKVYNGTDEYGVYWDVPVKNASGNLGFLFVNKESGDKDGADKNIAFNSSSKEFWCIQGSDEVKKAEITDNLVINFELPKNWKNPILIYKDSKGKFINLKMNESRPGWYVSDAIKNIKATSFYISDNKNKTKTFSIKTAKTYWITKQQVLSEKDTWIEPNEGIVFNSRDTKYKKPYGAVPQGTEVEFKFESNKNTLSKANLIIEKQTIIGDRNIEYNFYETIPMTKISEEGKDWWVAKFKFDEKNVYGYYFEIYINNYKRYLSGSGELIKVEHYKLPKTGGFAVKNTELPKEGQFIQTVYDKNFKTPDWIKDAVYYYIFPERFRNGNKTNDPSLGKDLFYSNKAVEFHKNWNDEKPWVPGNSDGNSSDDGEWCNDFYGGDLQGIIEKLDYLKNLGINTLYLNPIFEAPSNHKYDTADFMKIDDNFGTLDTFKNLVGEAKKRGIKVILDASLNHSGSDSVYMDRYGKYEGLGAFEKEKIRKDSPYYDWYEFNEKGNTPDSMYGQWANPTLANLNENSDSYKDFAIYNENSITKYWLKQGTAGWRMDVAPWVSDDFWREWRKAVKETNPDAITVSETWWDSSKYLLGDMFDSTMNYIFRATLFEYAKGNYSGDKANDILEMMRENYPQEAFYALMNLLSTHDSPRALWHFGYTERNDKDHYEKAVAKLKLSLLFQMTYPGAPAIFYGDEVGITGGADPNNRGSYPWADMGGSPDEKLLMETTKLIKLRNENPILRRGAIETLYSDENVIVYLREYEGKKAIIAINNSKEDKKIKFDTSKLKGTYQDKLNNSDLNINSNETTITIEKYWGKVLINK